MADIVTSMDLSAEFWALLHRMGLPENITHATVFLEVGEPVQVHARFYLTAPNGELRLVEDAITKASDNFVIVRKDELQALQDSLAAHREAGQQPGHYATGGLVKPSLATIGE